MDNTNQIATLSRFCSKLPLVKVLADLYACLHMRATGVSSQDWIRRTTHSISSKVFFTLSGKSLNLVDFVNGGGPCELKDRQNSPRIWNESYS